MQDNLCKNCGTPLDLGDKFCSHCGAKVVTERITVKRLLSDITTNVFGWDNKWFYTIRTLVVKPGILLREYFNGTRKKYVNPFSFLAIGITISLFAYSVFDQDLIKIMLDFSKTQNEFYANSFGGPFANPDYQREQLERSELTMRFMLKYFNLLALLTMPFYTLAAYLVYRKPYNYGEHLVVNCYIQGFSLLNTTLIFTLAIYVHPIIYFFIYPLLLFYYTYTYGKLYKLSIGRSILKIIVFLAFLFGSIVGLFILVLLAGFTAKYFLG